MAEVTADETRRWADMRDSDVPPVGPCPWHEPRKPLSQWKWDSFRGCWVCLACMMADFLMLTKRGA